MPDFGPLPKSRIPVLPGIGSHVMSRLPDSWYESCWIGEEIVGRKAWMFEDNSMNSDLYYDVPPTPTRSDTTHPPTSMDRTLIYHSEFDELAPKLSQYYRTRLERMGVGHTLVQPDPGALGWLDHPDDWTRMIFSGLLRSSTTAN